jgi:hypothetical protein
LAQEETPHDQQATAAQPDEPDKQVAQAGVAESRESVTQRERIYERSSPDVALRQGEILTNIIQLRVNLRSFQAGEEPSVDAVVHPYALIVTQDCDVVQDFTPRQQGQLDSDKILPSVLFCEVVTANDLRGRSEIKTDIWKRIRQNKDERYQFLEMVSPDDDLLGQGLPELGIDFKRYFTIPTEEVYHWLTLDARRRCRLVSPYLEHFSNRFYYYQGRIALPAEHRSE